MRESRRSGSIDYKTRIFIHHIVSRFSPPLLASYSLSTRPPLPSPLSVHLSVRLSLCTYRKKKKKQSHTQPNCIFIDPSSPSSSPSSSSLSESKVMRKPCCDKQDTNKGAWSKQEDQKLIDYVSKHGEGCWAAVPRGAGTCYCCRCWASQENQFETRADKNCLIIITGYWLRN